MKKILFVPYTYSLGGGAERVLSTVVSHLDKEKYDITILPYADYSVMEENTPSYVTLRKGIVDIEKAGKLEKGIKFFLVHFFPGILRKLYIREKYDIEISFNYQIPPFLVKRPKGTKVIEWNHGDIYDLRDKKIRRMLQGRSYRKADRIVTISENTRQSVCALFPEVENKIELIYNGVDIRRIQEKAAQEPPVVLREHSIIFLGRLEPAKRPIELLEVVRNMHRNGQRVSLYYLGKGELKEELGIEAREEDLEFAGFHKGYMEDMFYGNMFRDSEVSAVYVYRKTVYADQLTLQKEEVESVMWMELGQCVEAVRNHGIPNCIYLDELEMIERYLCRSQEK